MRILVTGGAGFIGSHLAERFVQLGHTVVVLDNLSTGRKSNVPTGAELIVGDVADKARVDEAMAGAELVFHEAAERAVLRSVEDPIGTDRSNTLGTLNVLLAARDAGAQRVVVASSSSIYGGVTKVPTSESAAPSPRSPYAVSKLAAETYSTLFAELYEVETVALRYFNVFGPRQRPDDQYSAVIPLFIRALQRGEQVEVHGDGKQSRDFTFIDDVVKANELAAGVDASTVSGKAYNIGRGESHSLLELLSILGVILEVEPSPKHVESRRGDVRLSQADISAARRDLGYVPTVSFEDGLRRTVSALLA